MTELSVAEEASLEGAATPTRLLAAAVRTVPAAALAAIGVAAAWRERGSIDAADWLGYAVLAALVLLVVAASGAAARPPRRLYGAALALLGLAGWDAVTIAWAASPELARDEALLTALYAVALLAPALAPRTRLDREVAAGAIGLALGGLAVATAVHLTGVTGAGAVYYGGRLDFPISYPNGQAAFVLAGFWPSLALAARRGAPVLLRALALGAAAAVTGGWVLTQSKGAAIGVGVSLVLVLALSRERLRLVPPLVLVAAATAFFFLPLTAPFRAADELAAIHGAGRAELWLTVVAAAAGLLYALVDRLLHVPPAASRAAALALLVLLVFALAGGCAAFLRAEPHPVAFVQREWTSFKHLPGGRFGTSHLTQLGSNRYDFWRVDLDEFRAHPLAGIGARGFRAAYLLHRRSSESPARGHSLELDALAETGIVGFLLLAAALVLVVAALARRARRELVALGALGAFVAWLVQASVDWTWTFPAVVLPVLALVGVAAAGPRPPPLRRRGRVGLAAAGAALALGAFGVPWLASYEVSAALGRRGDSSAELRRARELDPLSTAPLLAEWALAPRPAAGVAPLEQAVRMEPRSADLRYALWRQYLAAGELRAARRQLEAALRLDPHDAQLRSQVERLRRRSG